VKKVHFDLRRLPDGRIYWRKRGDAEFRPFTKQDFEKLREEFAKAEKSQLLDR
jgi:hypothetical protein